MEISWLNLLGHDLIGLILVGLMSEIWGYGAELNRFEQRWARFVARRRREQASLASEGLPGLGYRPDCADCQGKTTAAVEPASPSPWVESKRGRRREVKPTWQFCPDEDCRYYGWPGLGNLTSNGHPNSSPWRQWHCRAGGGYFVETRGTPLYRRTVAVEGVGRALTALAEGLSLQGTARLCRMEVETVALWLELAASHFADLTEYLNHPLEIDQIQLDDLYVRLRAAHSKQKGRVRWLYNAFDPVSKFWLGYSLGERSLPTVQHLVHQVIQRLVSGKIPLFLTDGEPSFESALLGHFGQWGEVSEKGQTQRRWLPLPELEYVQVVKQRVKRRLIQVKQRLVSGNLDHIRAKLAVSGWGINTAFIERFNLTLRQHVPALGRRVLAYAQSEAGLSRQLALVYLYYNYSLPHAALRQPGQGRRQQDRTPAMAVGLTDRVWRLDELLLIRVPPWSQARAQLGG
jgi:IS1 family transposase